jgi:hypothetical protein
MVDHRDQIARLDRRTRESPARAARALNVELVKPDWPVGRDIHAADDRVTESIK